MKINIKRINKLELLFIIITVVCVTRKIYMYTDNIFFTNAKAMVWIISSYFISPRRLDNYNLRKTMKYFCIPFVCMIAYTVVLWLLFGVEGLGTTFRYYTRLGSNFLWLFIMVWYAYRALIVFGDRALYLYTVSLEISYVCFAIIPAVLFGSFHDIILFLLGKEDTTVSARCLEVNDVSFALGIIAIAYLVRMKKINKKQMNTLFGLAFLIFMGGKRIEYLAIFVGIAFYFIIVKMINTRHVYLVSAITIISVSFAFFWLLYSGELDKIANMYGINFNYRLDTWSYWTELSKFSPTYLGLGSSYVDKETSLLVAESGILVYGHVLLNGMHGDLFKKYVELGFWGCFVWLYYISYYRVKKFHKKYGKEAGKTALIIMIYMFVLYFTDNSFDYFDTNVAMILAMCSFAFKDNATETYVENYSRGF